MAVDVDGQLTTLATDIVDTLQALSPPTNNQTPAQARKRAIDQTKITCQKMMAYLVTYLEVRGITINLDTGSRTIETYVGSAGSNGGSLTPAAPVDNVINGSVKDSKKDTGTQSNDGTGRVL